MAEPLTSRGIRLTALALAVVAAWAVKPVLAPVVLGAWAAVLARPWLDALVRRRWPRGAAAGLLTAGVVLLFMAALAFVVLRAAEAGLGLAQSMADAQGVRGALVALVHREVVRPAPQDLRPWLQAHLGSQGVAIGKWTAISGLGTVLFLFFLALATFSSLTEGERFVQWARAHAPLRPAHFDRLADAFSETGRGLAVSVGLTCLTQGALCSLIFFALGVPRPLALGLFCAIFAVLPVVGTPLVWLPVAAGFWLDGQHGHAIAMVALGGVLIGSVEFFIGPSFARLGHFQLPSPLILLSMFAGTLGLGPAGLVLGPLVFRLAKEALACARQVELERRARERAPLPPRYQRFDDDGLFDES